MRNTAIVFAAFIICLLSCKENTSNKTEESAVEAELSVPEKVAMAHGYDSWKDMEELKFTFNVDRDTSHYERSWIWKMKNNTVISIQNGDTLQFNRKQPDSTARNADAGFVNDKYWLLAPFQLMWDEGNYTFEYKEAEEAPISKLPLKKLTIVYGNEGGYTPGDAYDFYLGDDFVVKEWVFRRSNQPEPSLATTWEGYKDLGGIMFSTEHRNKEGFHLYFTGLFVE